MRFSGTCCEARTLPRMPRHDYRIQNINESCAWSALTLPFPSAGHPTRPSSSRTGSAPSPFVARVSSLRGENSYATIVLKACARSVSLPGAGLPSPARIAIISPFSSNNSRPFG